MISCLVVDFDHILRHWPVDQTQSIEEVFGLPDGAILTAAFQPAAFGRALTGQLTEPEWRTGVAHSLAARFGCNPIHMSEVVRQWANEAGLIDKVAVELIRKLSDHVPVVVAANATSRLDDDAKEHGLADFFSATYTSAKFGCCKPQAEFYRRLAKEIPYPPTDVLCVEYTDKHVIAANSAGFQAVKYTSHDTLRQLISTVDAA